MTFEVLTTNDLHRFVIATRYELHLNENCPSFLTVYGDDDFEDGERELRTFNLEYVIEYGWEGGESI